MTSVLVEWVRYVTKSGDQGAAEVAIKFNAATATQGLNNPILRVDQWSEVFQKKYLLCPDTETTWAKALYLIGRGKGEEGSQRMKTRGG